MDDGELMKVPDVAKYLKCPVRAVYRRVEKGYLPYRKLGKELIFFRPELDAMLKALPGATLKKLRELRG